MGGVIQFIKSQFSGYTIALILLSSLVLLFGDVRNLKSSGLEREASFSKIAGIVYLFIAGLAFTMGIFLPQ